MLKISNRLLTSPKFWDAFGKISSMAELEIVEKLKIVKLKRLLDDECSALRIAAKDTSIDEQNKLLEQNSNVDFCDQIEVPLKLLTADEIYSLDGFLKEE